MLMLGRHGTPSGWTSASGVHKNEKFCTFSRPRPTYSITTSFMVTSYPAAVLATQLPQNQGVFKSGPEFPLFSQRVLVALDTDQGVVYAPASGWDRAFLLWTFRNFRSLPQNVLSPRQQQLMGSLYRKASNGDPHELCEAPVVGTVEDFRPSSLATLPSSDEAAKLVAGASRKNPAIARVLGRQPFFARFTFNRMTLKIGTAALVVVIAVLAWHQLGAQPVADSASTQTVAAAHPTDQPIARAKDMTRKDLSPAIVKPASNPVALPSAIPIAGTTSTNGTPGTAPAHGGTAATAIQAREAPPGRSAEQSITAQHAAAKTVVSKAHTANADHSAAAPPSIYQFAADQPRMQISGRPRKLVYPVCPETQARGKVSLQAVVNYDGAVSRVRVLTGDRALAAAAVEAVRQWRYEPFSGAAPRLERETNITISFISNEVVAVSFPGSAPLSR
jgi:TonB family protein